MKFDYNEINLVPRKCIVNSRSECDTSVILGNFKFKSPVIPANMECVLNEDLSIKLGENGYFYILHRFLSNEEILLFINKVNLLNSTNSDIKIPISISVGVNKESYDLINDILNSSNKIDFITIDIAHGHSIKMEKMITFIKEKLPNTFIIAGNVSTIDAVNDLEKWGANAIKVGIGPGSSCTTYPATGFGSRNCQASTILNCRSTIPIIADGGIKVPGDIAKSLVLGADMVMVGGMLSGFNDSPGDLIEVDGKLKKEFWGSASKFQSNKKNRIEGTKYLIDYKDHSILDEMNYLKECLQSSISYGGGKNLNSLKEVKWIK